MVGLGVDVSGQQLPDAGHDLSLGLLGRGLGRQDEAVSAVQALGGRDPPDGADQPRAHRGVDGVGEGGRLLGQGVVHLLLHGAILAGMASRPTRIPPGPGQESVWDYPDPTASSPPTAASGSCSVGW